MSITFHSPYLPHELDAHPDAGRIKATIEMALQDATLIEQDLREEIEEDYEAEIRDLKSEIGDRERDISNLEVEIEDLNRRIESLEDQIREERLLTP